MNDDDDEKPRLPPLGDIGIIAVAALFTVIAFWLILSPPDFSQMVKKAEPQPAGEVSVGIPPASGQKRPQ